MDQIIKTNLTPERQKYISKGFGKHAIYLTGIDGYASPPISFELYEKEILKGLIVTQLFWGQLYIKYLFVEESYRGLGYGQKLVDHAVNYGRQQGCQLSFVETMNFQAPKFYEKMGFQLDFKREGYDKGTILYYFSKDLNKPALITSSLIFKVLDKSDIPGIESSCAKQNYVKPASLFEQYWDEQNKQQRVICLAFLESQFAGYITLKWYSTYQPFIDQNIPVIMDLNVLPDFRKMGIGSKLLDWAEAQAKTKSKKVGLRVGLYKGRDDGYGPAQRLYIKRGYEPDGNGITYKDKIPEYGTLLPLDDDLVLWFTKSLR